MHPSPSTTAPDFAAPNPVEHWWGGATTWGHRMPFADGVELDLRNDCHGNQAAPLLLSTQGRWIWCDQPFRVRFVGGEPQVESNGLVRQGKEGGGLRGAYLGAAQRFFPPRGILCDERLFLAPQYNTWIELGYCPSQDSVLAYADDLLRHGYPPGVLMIDDGWMRSYGDWHFRADRFPDPRRLVSELHDKGFQVMLWLIPFISPDLEVFRELRAAGALVRDAQGNPVLRQWWNGYSAMLDITGGAGRAWFRRQMQRLHEDPGVDGFKFDGADTHFFQSQDVTATGAGPNEQTQAYGDLGNDWRLAEFRAAWKNGGGGAAQRLRDKAHAWGDDGLATLIPHAIAAGLLGHAYICPDMIGGGDIEQVRSATVPFDPELFVRYAQCAALMPMMQFSAAPWRRLGPEEHAWVQAAVRLHQTWGPRIVALARDSARTGEPLVRGLAYQYPGLADTCQDQFFLGPDVLVAPVIEKGSRTRRVVVPPGVWRDDAAQEHRGPAIIEVPAPLSRLPHFQLQ